MGGPRWSWVSLYALEGIGTLGWPQAGPCECTHRYPTYGWPLVSPNLLQPPQGPPLHQHPWVSLNIPCPYNIPKCTQTYQHPWVPLEPPTTPFSSPTHHHPRVPGGAPMGAEPIPTQQLLLQRRDLRGRRRLLHVPLPAWLHGHPLPAPSRRVPGAALPAGGHLRHHRGHLPLPLPPGIHRHPVPGECGGWHPWVLGWGGVYQVPCTHLPQFHGSWAHGHPPVRVPQDHGLHPPPKNGCPSTHPRPLSPPSPKNRCQVSGGHPWVLRWGLPGTLHPPSTVRWELGAWAPQDHGPPPPQKPGAPAPPAPTWAPHFPSPRP